MLPPYLLTSRLMRTQGTVHWSWAPGPANPLAHGAKLGWAAP